MHQHAAARLALLSLAAAAPALAAADLLPQSTVATGTRDIARAWLAAPTDRYPHAVLGDALEAGALRVETADGRVLSAVLPESQVFEDLTPRLADLDGDGRDEVIVVRSDVAAGAALAVYGIEDGRLAEEAATPPVGRPNRWLNPVGAADLDLDGRMEVAYVETPHIGGVLKVWEWRDGGLRLEATARGVSNHAIGSPELALSAVAEVSGDGGPDLVVPSQDRMALRIFSLLDGVLAVRDVPLPGCVTGAITRGAGVLVVPTEAGEVFLALK